MNEQYGAVYFDVRELQDLVVPHTGEWSIAVKSTWGGDPRINVSKLETTEWWKANNVPTEAWSSAPVEVIAASGYDEPLISDADFQVVSIRSALIPLDTAAMTLLVNTQFQVEVHGQRVGVDEAPMLLGQAVVPLSSVITGLPGLDAYFPLGENNGGGKIRVRVYLDDELARMAAGSSLLQVTAASFGPLPSTWALPAPANTPPEGVEQALAAVPSGPLGQKQQYSLTLPNLLPTQATSSTVPLPPVVLLGGALEYAGNGIWGLTWAVSAPALWLPSSAHGGLQAALKDDAPLTVKVAWKGCLPPPPDAPPAKGAPKKAGKAVVPEDKEVSMEVATTLSLQPFAEPGATMAYLEATLPAPETPVASDPALPLPQGVMSVQVYLAKPLVDVPADVVPTLAPLDILPLRELVPKKPPRDVEAEFQKEVVDSVRVLSEEYVKAFVVKTRMKDLSLDDKRKRYFYLLNSSGLYHELKEKLKPRIQRLVRKRFGQAPQDERQKDELVSTLYSSLMEHVNVVISKRVKETRDASEDPIYEPAFPETQRLSMARLSELGMLADDAEANDQWDTATKHHEDRITIAQALVEGDESASPRLLDAWSAFGTFCLRVPLDVQPDRAYHLRGREALKEALAISRDDNSLLHAYAALLLEDRQYHDAKEIMGVITQRSQASVLTYVLLSLHADVSGDFANTRGYLHKAAAAYDPSNLEDLGVPRRTAVVALLEVADFLIRHNLVELCQRTLDVADKCEATALDKAKERAMQTVTPVSLRVRNRRLRAQALLSLGNLDQAAQEAAAATEICNTDGWSWVTLGEAKLKLGRVTDAKTAFAKALDALTRAGAQVPPRVFMRLGSLYLLHADIERSREVMLRCCAEHMSPSGWLRVGMACIKLNELEDAEDALQEANVLDNRNGDVWGYLALLLLLNGEERLHEASAALQQALKYGMTSTSLLRELASAHISIDHLSTAEDLLRRSLTLDPAPYTRRLLADVLASQNALTQASAEYKIVLESDDVEDWQRDDAFQQYSQILKALGRESELVGY